MTTTIAVLDGPRDVVLNGVPAIRLVLRFERDGVDVTPPDFNPWHIVGYRGDPSIERLIHEQASEVFG